VVGAWAVVLVVVGCVADNMAAEAGLSGFLNVLNGALVVAVGAVDEVADWEPNDAGVDTPMLKTFTLGVVDDVVGATLRRFPKNGALVDGVCEPVPLKSGFVFSVSGVPAATLDGVEDGNWEVLDLSDSPDDVADWKNIDGAAVDAEGIEEDCVLVWPSAPNNDFWGPVNGEVDDWVFGAVWARPPKSGFWGSEIAVVAGLMPCAASAGLVQLNEESGCCDLSPPKKLAPDARGWVELVVFCPPGGWKGSVIDLPASFFPNKLFPVLLPPKRLVGGGPAGVVVDWKGKPDVAGVVEPAGVDEGVPPIEAFPNTPLDSPGPELAPLKKGFGGVCEPPKGPNDVVAEPPPIPPKAPLGVLPVVAPVDGLFSPALGAPKLAKLKLLPACLPAFPPPKRLLPEDWPVLASPKGLLAAGFELPKRVDDADAFVEGVPPKLNFGGSLDMLMKGENRTLEVWARIVPPFSLFEVSVGMWQ
jgi:hypothetical protein